MSIEEESIILEGSLKRCKKYKLFKTKWVEHYFVLYCRDRSKNLYAIDEYKSSRKSDLKKRFKLEYVVRVESNLSLSDQSILCSSANQHRQEPIHSIFGVGFRFQNFVKELYLVAKNDEEMTLWVNELCKICQLHRQKIEDIEGDVAGSSISGMSMSSQSLDMSIIEQQQFSENNPDQSKFRHHFKSVNSQPSIPQNPNYNNLPDTRSETSSMYSSRRTEDDSVSYTSGPPIPPPRTRHTQQNRFVKVFQNGQVGRLHMIPASTSMGPVIRVEDAEDSSGETVKMKYPDSIHSADGITVYEKNGKTMFRRANPPPIDRTSKPRNMRGEEEGNRYRNLHNANPNSHYSNNYSNKITNYISEASKRRNLDYFEPTQLVENSSSSTVAATSTRSPTPSDIEYISVDVDRTLAFKQMRRAAQSTD